MASVLGRLEERGRAARKRVEELHAEFERRATGGQPLNCRDITVLLGLEIVAAARPHPVTAPGMPAAWPVLLWGSGHGRILVCLAGLAVPAGDPVVGLRPLGAVVLRPGSCGRFRGSRTPGAPRR